jgi:hypothetical protein
MIDIYSKKFVESLKQEKERLEKTILLINNLIDLYQSVDEKVEIKKVDKQIDVFKEADKHIDQASSPSDYTINNSSPFKVDMTGVELVELCLSINNKPLTTAEIREYIESKNIQIPNLYSKITNALFILNSKNKVHRNILAGGKGFCYKLK